MIADVPIERVQRIASRGVCWEGCTDFKCDAARLAKEVLRRRRAEEESEDE